MALRRVSFVSRNDLLHAPLAHLFFVIIPTFGFYILFYLAFLPIGRLHDFAKHGDLSYGIYLYAYPIQRLLIAGQVRGYRLTHLTLFYLPGFSHAEWRF